MPRRLSEALARFESACVTIPAHLAARPDLDNGEKERWRIQGPNR
jgi:hypothetical protein